MPVVHPGNERRPLQITPSVLVLPGLKAAALVDIFRLEKRSWVKFTLNWSEIIEAILITFKKETVLSKECPEDS